MDTVTVLIADDDRAVLRAFSRLLDLLGYAVLTATDGEQAIQVYDQERPDITIVDLCMPLLDGLGVIRAILERDPEAEVILVTGYDDIETTLATTQTAGATDVITKPVDGQVLEATLQRAQERLRVKKTS